MAATMAGGGTTTTSSSSNYVTAHDIEEAGKDRSCGSGSEGNCEEASTCPNFWHRLTNPRHFCEKCLGRSPSKRPTDLYDVLLKDGDEGAEPFLGGRLRMGSELFKRRMAIGIVFYTVLLGDANRGLVLPTLQGYLNKFGGTATQVGIANAGFSLGRLIAAPIYGYWMDKRNAGEVIVFSMVISAVANVMYTYASSLGEPTVVIVAMRTFLGVGASVLGVGRAYIAKITSKAERGPYIAILCALQYAGFTLTAFISMIVSSLNADISNRVYTD